MTAIRHTIIKASAGSGKTFRLSTRYLQLLALNESPEKILATTFTRKAAAEISSRVFLRLAKGAQSATAASALGREIEAPLSQTRCVELLNALVTAQHRLNICTMDSFCNKIARAFALELGFNPTWEIIDDEEDLHLRAQAVEHLLGTLKTEELAALTRLASNDAAGRSVYENLLRNLNQLYKFYLNSEPGAWEAFSLPQDPPEEYLAAAKEALESHWLPKTKEGEYDKRWFKVRTEAVESLRQGAWETLFYGGLGARVAAGQLDYYKKSIPTDVQEIYETLLAHARLVVLTQAKQSTAALAKLLQHFDESYRSIKGALGAYQFTDVKRALSGATLFEDLSALYYRLDSRIHHLLLDEFQDTSCEEWNVITPLAAEILAQGEDRRSFFCVGDVKQAIYAWRGGVAEIFDHVEERYQDVLQQEQLTESRRSAPEIINFVNKVFSSLPESPALADFPRAAATWSKRFSQHSAFEKDRPGYVSFKVVSPRDAETGDDALYRELADLVAEIIQRAPQAQIGILTRTNKTAARIRYELQKIPWAIHAKEEGGSPVVDSPAVSYILSLFTLADHPGDSCARYHVATSPLGVALKFTDHNDGVRAGKLAAEMRNRLVSDGYGATVQGLVALLIPSSCQRDRTRLYQLGELALAFQAKAGLRPSAFVDYVQEAKRESSGDASVRVMTVHRSKGLEFDAVILPELDHALRGNNSRGVQLLYERSSPLTPYKTVLRAPSAKYVVLDPQLTKWKEAVLAETAIESLSVLYVGLTRAKSALYLLTTPESDAEPKATFAGHLLSVTAPGVVPSPGLLLYEAGSKDWEKQFAGQAESSAACMAKAPEVRLKERPCTTRMLSRVSPSDLEGGQTKKVDDIFGTVGSKNSRTVGALLHRFYQELTWSNESEVTVARQAELAAELGVEASGLEHAQRIFAHSLSFPEIYAIFNRSRYGSGAIELWRERSFALRIGQDLLTGAFDRVVIERQDEKFVAAEVIDFKSDDIPAHELQNRAAYYRPQLEAYRKALSIMLELPAVSIKCALVFAQAGRVVPV